MRRVSKKPRRDGIRTADLGGSAGTQEFTDEVIRRVKSKREVWSALA